MLSNAGAVNVDLKVTPEVIGIFGGQHRLCFGQTDAWLERRYVCAGMQQCLLNEVLSMLAISAWGFRGSTKLRYCGEHGFSTGCLGDHDFRFRLGILARRRNHTVSMSRAGWWREHATARVVGPATDPNLPVRTRRRLLKRNKLGAAHDPALPGDRDLVSPLTIIVAAAPLPSRISVATAIDPRIMSKRLRSLRYHPNERDPKQRDPA
jgi:hypothetical protein